MRDLENGLLDLIYPPRCLACGDIQPLYICESCRELITFLLPPLCGRCGLPVEGEPCQECQRTKFSFTSARAVGVYEGPLRTAIHELKYSGRTAIAPELGSLLSNFLATCPKFAPNVSCVIPVPIHRLRERERGFNQSKLLGRYVAEFLCVPMRAEVLERTRMTKPQFNLLVEERLENLKDAFGVVDADPIVGKSVLLVDDVLTTGSTANEASKALRAAGAEHIYVLTLARSCG